MNREDMAALQRLERARDARKRLIQNGSTDRGALSVALMREAQAALDAAAVVKGGRK